MLFTNFVSVINIACRTRRRYFKTVGRGQTSSKRGAFQAHFRPIYSHDPCCFFFEPNMFGTNCVIVLYCIVLYCTCATSKNFKYPFAQLRKNTKLMRAVSSYNNDFAW